MILVIGAYPSHENEKDGMYQRVATIDKVLSFDERVYLDIRFLKAFFQKTKVKQGVTLLRINFFLFLPLICYYALKANFVYSHTIVNSIKVLPLYLFKKTFITDLHGVCPEEYTYIGRPIIGRIFSVVERYVFFFGKVFITVSHPMEAHFRVKYSCRNKKFFNIPIFQLDDVDTQQLNKSSREIIYAGGVQRWQNIDKMTLAIKNGPKDISYNLLVSNPGFMERKLEEYKVDTSNIKILSVPRDEVAMYYRSAEFGFVLREKSIVNQVACPTKLIEYMNYGIIPIVDEDEIGDFKRLGYAYLNVQDFVLGLFPDSDKILAMRQKNYEVICSLMEEQKENLGRLNKYIQDISGKGGLLLDKSKGFTYN